MTTTVHDILSAVAEAKGALEREPTYQRCISDLQNSLLTAQTHSQELELNIQSYKDTIDQLQSKVRSLEVERDDASFRLLEAEDKIGRFTNDLAYATQMLQGMANQLSPPQQSVEPIPLSEMKEAVQGTISEPFVAVPSEIKQAINEGLMGESASPLPAAPMTETQSPSVPPTVASTDTVSPPKPYEGRNWSAVFPRVYSRNDWDAGGGSEGGWCDAL